MTILTLTSYYGGLPLLVKQSTMQSQTKLLSQTKFLSLLSNTIHPVYSNITSGDVMLVEYAYERSLFINVKDGNTEQERGGDVEGYSIRQVGVVLM